jgi:hypothetical protein
MRREGLHHQRHALFAGGPPATAQKLLMAAVLAGRHAQRDDGRVCGHVSLQTIIVFSPLGRRSSGIRRFSVPSRFKPVASPFARTAPDGRSDSRGRFPLRGRGGGKGKGGRAQRQPFTNAFLAGGTSSRAGGSPTRPGIQERFRVPSSASPARLLQLCAVLERKNAGARAQQKGLCAGHGAPIPDRAECGT